MKKRILSGMRPTGRLHLGHLVGALDNWVRLQEDYECFFMVADWHALMGEYENAKGMREFITDNLIDWLSAGIDPQKSAIFVQSEVGAHLDLHMIFSCLTPLGWLERCPTYKEQLREAKARDLHTYGFLGYPVLQAADILLYKAEKVPVGEDQLAHLELTREIARRFNSLYHCEVFPEPQALLTEVPRVLGTDGRKMSKSYDNAVNLSDSQETILKKISSMITDPQRIRMKDLGHPEVCSVYAYYCVFLAERKSEVYDWCSNAKIGCTECKKRMAEGLIARLAPLRQRRQQLLQDPAFIQKILADGRERALVCATETLAQAKEAMGFWRSGQK